LALLPAGPASDRPSPILSLGNCIIDWTACLSFSLGNVGRIVADNTVFAGQLKHKLDEERCWPTPDIRIKGLANAA